MITQMRKYVKSNFFKGLILLICLLMTGILSIPMLIHNHITPWVFKINNTLITKNKFDFEVRQQEERLQQFRAYYGQLSEYLLRSLNMSSDPKELATQQLQQNALLCQFANALGFKAKSAIAQSMLASGKLHHQLTTIIPEYVFNENGTVNQYGFKAYLQRKQISVDALYDEIAEELSGRLLNSLIKVSGNVPKALIDHEIIGHHGTKVFNYITFDLDTFVNQMEKEDPSESTLQSFFEKHKEQFIEPEKRTVSVWTFSPDRYGVEITSDMIHDYYEKNKNARFVKEHSLTTIRQIVYEKNPINKPSIADLRAQLLQDPSAFAEKATLFSDDTKSASNGGLLQPFARKTLEPAIEKAAFALENPGDISDVIVTEKGFALIQLINRTPRTYVPLNQVSKEIEKILQKELFSEMFSANLHVLGDLTNEKVKMFSSDHGGTRTKEERTFNKQDIISSMAFATDKGFFAFNTIHDKGYVILVEDVKLKKLPVLGDIKKSVVEAWRSDQGMLKLNSFIGNIKKELKTDDLLSIGKKLNLSVYTTNPFSRNDEEQLKILKKNCAAIEDALVLTVPGTISFGFDGKRGYIAQLHSINKPLNYDVNENRSMAIAINEQNRKELVRGLIASLYKDAKIEYSDNAEISLEDYIL